MKYTAESENLAIELARLDMEQRAIEKKKAAEIKAAADMVKLEKIRIEREAAAIKEAQEAAAAEAYTWMKVFSALDDRGLEADKIMTAIKQMQEQGHTAEMCLEMIEKTAIKPKAPPAPKKEPPRPAAFGTWA
ncbi:hypothetical protein CNR34_00108 [Pseudomonas phage nickie]|uniref:Uncharacterized protein n=1 Tax=Pseudomonas phage nickie TaxID=2048977 RepID=A0A2H4P795_9CAUD|nr:hypothetical protein FDJ16_gp057 [Pseudomonas phage nickie]ATW58041.1 hypothetical protein CNR34_00108 [Pseudomonas phage nickie]